MAAERAPATIERVRDPDRIKRYTLVPRPPADAKPDGVKHFTLARIGASPRPAPGADRLERMEQIVEAERERQSRNGGDPAHKPAETDTGDQDSLS